MKYNIKGRDAPSGCYICWPCLGQGVNCLDCRGAGVSPIPYDELLTDEEREELEQFYNQYDDTGWPTVFEQ